jgi:hypothetical protein
MLKIGILLVYVFYIQLSSDINNKTHRFLHSCVSVI